MDQLETIDTTRLRWFVAVAEELHFARAARTLGISRQRLSATVTELESELARPLFVPGAQSTRLTAAGEQALAAAREILARSEETVAQDIPAGPGAFRVGYVPGVTMSKWADRWAERYPDEPLELIGIPQAEQLAALRDGRVDMCLVRLPIDREGLHAIPLYKELAVAVVPKDHPISLFDEVVTADLAAERMQDASDLDDIAATLDLVAAVGGAAIVPHSLARLHHRRDLVYRTVTDVAPTEIALAWPAASDDERTENFIGIVRGRTVNSSRTPQPRAQTQQPRRAAKPRQATRAKPARSTRRRSR
ncbi:LysR family transcriptional regulator [Nocardia stercoris]|uniref:LysR family transcriptional regulator n=1 Tax=Nocardia stercoris TaxID=2483361 RepID=A0A3M2LE02_9NOCA|nr:LysR family transcriptional regulator [Nocardia stercoris]RMI35634.1 LysR family transcriptional regulator [Nocardia stercoris]